MVRQIVMAAALALCPWAGTLAEPVVTGWETAAPVSGSPAGCDLLPLAEQLARPEVRLGTPQYANLTYRNTLLKYVNGYYPRLATDLLRGEGPYLDALHAMMGSAGPACAHAYRALLLQEETPQGFALALWGWRETAGTGGGG